MKAIAKNMTATVPATTIIRAADLVNEGFPPNFSWYLFPQLRLGPASVRLCERCCSCSIDPQPIKVIDISEEDRSSGLKIMKRPLEKNERVELTSILAILCRLL